MNERNSLLQEKWLAGLVWIALLLALVVTSFQALSVIARSGVSNLLLSLLSGQITMQGNPLGAFTIIAIALILVAAGLVLFAWLRFGHLTNEVMIALAFPRDDEEPVFRAFLDLSEAGSEAERAEGVFEARGSLFGDVIRLLALTWAVLLVIGPLISVAA